MTTAIAQTVDTYNIRFVVAAGNNNDNVWWYAPSSAPRAITVAGLSRDADTKWYMSNYGNTTAFYAPAQYVEAASLKIRALDASLDHDYVRSELDDNANCTDTCNSGTSFAAPHMTGVIARYLERHPGATRDQIVSELQRQSSLYSGSTVYEPATGQYLPVLVFNDCP